MEQEKHEQEVHIRGAPNRCPYCRDIISDRKEVVACAACGARHHEACHSEHGACSSCGASEVLVARSRARERREHPPKGSTIEVQKLLGTGVKYSWHGFAGQMIKNWLLIAIASVVLIPLVPWIWIRYLQKKRSQVVLQDDLIELVGIGMFGTKTYTARREDVGAIKLERAGQQGFLRLTVDIGVDRITIGSLHGMPVLKEPEIEWLYEALLAWKEQG